MTKSEREYLNKRMNELLQKKTQLLKEQRKIDKEIKTIQRKLGEE